MIDRDKMAEGSQLTRAVKPVMISTLAGTIVCIVGLLAFSLIMSTQNIPQAVVGPMAIFAVCVGAMVSGFLCSKMMRENGLAWGLVCGIMLSLVMIIASFSVAGNGFGLTTVFKVIFMLLSSMIGGVAGVNTRTKSRSSKRR